MRTKSILTLVILLMASISYAADATFSWLPNSETDLAGYKIHYGQEAGVYTETVDCGLPEIVDGRVSYTMTDISDSVIYYGCTAYDTHDQSSDYSNEVSSNPEPAVPGEFSVLTINMTVNINR